MFKVEKAMKSCIRDKDTKALQRGKINSFLDKLNYRLTATRNG